jgi:SOS-response transcriptional repressor LexA
MRIIETMQNTWYERAKARMEELGLKQRDLIDVFGVETRGAVGHYLSGRRKPKPDQLAALAAKLEWSLDRLMYGRENPRLEGTKLTNIQPVVEIKGAVPLISWVRAGQWCEAVDQFEPGYAEQWIPFTKPVGTNAFALKVEGDSMVSPYPGMRSYPPGTIIIVDPDAQVYSGRRVVAKLADTNEVTFKEYAEDGGRRYLKPLNPQYPTLDITNLPVVFCGVVVGSVTEE